MMALCNKIWETIVAAVCGMTLGALLALGIIYAILHS